VAISGVFTNIGVAKAQEAQSNQGFKIYPTDFSVSDVAGTLDPARTTPNVEWFSAPISSRVVIDSNTIKFICTIPPGAMGVSRTVREIYIKGVDSLSVPFIFVIGQPSSPIEYNPSGSLTLELQIALTNADLSSIINFQFTQATEIAEHNTSPNAHSEIVAAINKAGIYYNQGAGPEPFKYRGQSFDEKAEWDGVKATAAYSGVTWTADHQGTDGNAIVLLFDGVKTTDQVRAAWNNTNPFNSVSHNGTGSEIHASNSLSLSGGTLLVSNKDAVYKDVDGIYKRAIADGTIRSKVIGFADFDTPIKRIVRTSGFITKTTTGFVAGDNIFLSSTTPGAITGVSTSVQMGFVVSTDLVLIGTGGGSSGAAADFDAIVSNSLGFKRYSTTQLAITAAPDGGRILVDKLESIQTMIDTQNKRLDIYFNGPEAGWTKYLGTAEKQHISFSSVPTSGTWRIEWNSQQTTDLAWNASTTAIANAINLLSGPGLPVTVTGSYAAGFDIEWSSLLDVPQITFNHAGTNQIERVAFSDTPDNGTARFSYNGNETHNLAWNDDAALFSVYLNETTGINNVGVSGSFGLKYFDIEWSGIDGKSPRSTLANVADTLTKGVTPVTVGITVTQQGVYPASNLKASATPIAITVQTLVGGSVVGPGTCIQVTKDYTRFVGLGLMQNFDTGIDLNGHIGVDVEMEFNNTVLPISNTGLIPGRDYHTEKSFGITQQKLHTVGTWGDHATLWDAVAAADVGDKIVVMSDQTLTTNQTINKELEIIFTHGAQINCPVHLSGALITLGTRVRTRYMKLVVTGTGSFDTGFLLTGSRGYHEDLTLELSHVATIMTNCFELGSGAMAIYCHGMMAWGSATFTNGILNTSNYASHDIVIRDVDSGRIYSAVGTYSPKLEQASGVVDGVNAVFTTTAIPVDAMSTLVMVDSLPRFPGIHYNFVGNVITFTAGNEPPPGEDVWVWYLINGVSFITNPKHFEVQDHGVTVTYNTRYLNFGAGFSVTQDSSEKVTMNIVGDVSETPTGSINGVNTQFTLAHTPISKVATKVSVNGLYIKNSTWTLSGSVITLGFAPAAGSDIEVNYAYSS
jgi:hypothetical protein